MLIKNISYALLSPSSKIFNFLTLPIVCIMHQPHFCFYFSRKSFKIIQWSMNGSRAELNIMKHIRTILEYFNQLRIKLGIARYKNLTVNTNSIRDKTSFPIRSRIGNVICSENFKMNVTIIYSENFSRLENLPFWSNNIKKNQSNTIYGQNHPFRSIPMSPAKYVSKELSDILR